MGGNQALSSGGVGTVGGQGPAHVFPRDQSLANPRMRRQQIILPVRILRVRIGQVLGLGAIMNVLVGLDLLTKDNDGRYALTAESTTFLVPGKSTFCVAFFLLTSEPMLSEWRKLHEIVRSGQPKKNINQERDGVPFFLRFVGVEANRFGRRAVILALCFVGAAARPKPRGSGIEANGLTVL